jgi:PAS domain S-box-containing protein
MVQNKHKDLLLDQIPDLIWAVDKDLKLVYSNRAYLNFTKEITGANDPQNIYALVDGLGEKFIKKWKAFYLEALSGECVETDDYFYNEKTKDIQYRHITFSPVRDSSGEILSVACRSTDISPIVRQKNIAECLLDTSTDIYCAINQEGNFIYISEASKAIWGFTPKELIGTNHISLLVDEDVVKTNNIISETISENKTISFTNKYLTKEQNLVLNYWTIHWDSKSQLVYCAVKGRKNPLEKKQLKQSEERFEALIQEGSDLISILDTEGNYTYVSPTSNSVLGISPDTFLGKNAFDFIHPDDAEKTLQFLKQITAEKTVHVEPFRFRDQWGEWRWVETVLTNMLDNPAVNGIVANSRDITGKVEETHRLRLFEKVINSISDAVIITDAEPLDEPGPVIQYVNEAFTQMTGYTPEDVIGKNPRILQGPGSNQEDLRILGEKLRRWESAEITVLNYNKVGEPFWVNFAVSPLSDENGWFTHWISVQRDVTEQKNKELEKELLAQISACFREEDLSHAGSKLCKVIREFGDFDLIELWSPNLERTHMTRIAFESNFKDFNRNNNSLTQALKGEGLPGKVWEQGQQLLWDQAEITKYFVRKKAAENTGLQHILGIPLTNNNQINGTLIIGTTKDINDLSRFSSLIKKLESAIGAEIKRKRLEDDLKQIYEAIPEILCVTDLTGRFLRINPAGCTLLGYKEEDILFKFFQDFLHPNDKKTSENELHELKNGATSFQFENRFITSEGKIVWLSWNCNSSIDDGLIYAAAKDISEEKKLRSLINQANSMAKIGQWEVDIDKGTVYWSDMVHELHETDPNSFVPDFETAVNFYREDFRPMVTKVIDDAIANDGTVDFEAVIVTKKLKERWVRAIGRVEQVDSVSKRFFGSFQDIHQRKVAELRLQSIANDLPGVTFQYHLYPDGTDRLFTVSNGSQRIWGLSPQQCEENIDLVWDQIKKGGDFERVVQDITKSIETKTQWHSTWRNILPDGQVRWHEGFGTPYFQLDGTVIYNSMIFDYSEKKQAVDLYSEASEMAKIGNWELNFTKKDNTDNMYWSPMLKRILEVNKDYNPSLSGGFEFYEGESKGQIQKAVEKLIESGSPFDLELLVQTDKGNRKWIRCIGRGEFLDGSCSRIFGSFQDIHEQKTVEMQLKTVTDNLPGVIYQYLLYPDGKDQLLYISEGSHKVWGLSPKECINSPEKIWQQIEAGGDKEKVKRSILESASHLTPWFTQWKNVSLNGTVKWYEGRGLPQKLSDGTILWNSLIIDITEKKEFEAKYQQAQVERATILESISDAFYAVDANWNFTYFNKEAENLLKKSSEEVVGQNIWEIFYPATGTILEEVYRRVSSNGQSENFEYHYPGDGSWYEITAYPSNGGISSYFKNIDNRRKAAKDLERAYKEKSNILESISDAFIAVDNEWMVTYWNNQAETILGRKKHEIIGKNIWEIYPDAIDSDFHLNYQNAMETGETIQFEEYYPPLDIWLEVTVYPSESGLSIYFKDITLRKAADIRLMEANERLELVTKATNDTIWDWDIKNGIFYRSDNIQNLFGKNAATKLAENQFWLDAFHPKDMQRLRKSIREALRDPQTERWEMEYTIFNEDDEELFIMDRGIIIRDKHGKATRMVGAMINLTRQKKLEKELFELNEALENYAKVLERSNEELEQFAFITSHDLQEPLRMVSSFMDQLKRKYGDQLDEKALLYIHYAMDGAQRMKQIILDLLLYSRANRPTEQLEQVDLNEIVTEYTLLRRKLIAETKASITFDRLPVLQTYKAPITQIFHCLLDNALKYMKENEPPRIEIKARENESTWEFAVKDNGIGIDQKFYEKIFAIFQRLHNRDQYNGTGIGLSIVKKSVTFLGGDVWLESEIGKGSVFYFTIEKSLKPNG